MDVRLELGGLIFSMVFTVAVSPEKKKMSLMSARLSSFWKLSFFVVQGAFAGHPQFLSM